MYLAKTPILIQRLFPRFAWRIPAKERVIYLTFDDGPIPDVTPWVLDQLAAHGAKATFFCVGDNVRKHGEVFRQVLAQGHTVGNHTFNHLDGWAVSNEVYEENVRICADLVDTALFRPPYGRLRPAQAEQIRRRYRIVLWDVLSGDFDPKTSKEICLENVLHHTVGGSIVVFHDSRKAWEKLQYALPKVLEHFSERGYRFEALTADLLPALVWLK